MTVATWEIRTGDVLDRLREMPDESVHCVVTSPPYWGLRSYIEDGHELKPLEMGLEPDPSTYIARMVEVFREVRRVLRSDGTCWVNMGDGYNNRNVTRPSSHQGGLGFVNESTERSWADATKLGLTRLSISDGDLKEKDLIGMPWMLAFALRADGWWLRSEIIWAKPNPMPESVTDRPTKAHEQLFLLAKRERYFYDANAVREANVTSGLSSTFDGRGASWHDHRDDDVQGDRRDAAHNGKFANPAGRNARSVWNIATAPFAEAHFATFPPELPRRCIAAGTSERGVCAACGAPWRRVVEPSPEYAKQLEKARGWGDWYPRADGPDARERVNERGFQYTSKHGKPFESSTSADYRTTGWEPTCAHEAPSDHDADTTSAYAEGSNANRLAKLRQTARKNGGQYANDKTTTGWDPGCTHPAEPIPATVLDPFAGSGTTIMVALRMGRSGIGIELNPEYAAMARNRILDDRGWDEAADVEASTEGVQARLAL